MKRSIRQLAAYLASCGVVLVATSVHAQTVPTIPVPATRSGPGGSANPVLPNAAAQSPATQRQTVVGAPRPAAPATAATASDVVVSAVDTDRLIATWVALDHYQEVQLGNLARDKASASKVKLLAIQMADDHNRALADLAALYPDAVAPIEASRPGVPMQPTAPARPDSTVPPTSTVRPALPEANRPPGEAVPAGVPLASSVLELKRRVDNQCLVLAQRKLSEKQGVDFDVAYVVMMLVKHQELYATLQAFRELATPELRKILDAQMQTTQIHYGHAEQLMPEVASRAYVAQTPGAVPR